MRIIAASWLLAVIVHSSGIAAQEHDVFLTIERADSLHGPWVPVAVDGSMLHGGRVHAERTQSDRGFYRMQGELVPVATPTPTPTPAPTIDAVNVPGGSQTAWFGTAWIEGFAIGRYEVTGALWAQVRDWAVARGYDLAGVGTWAGPDFPVGSLTWYDAVKWCNALSEWAGLAPVYYVNGAVYRSGTSDAVTVAGGNGWRLPTEREWEWAARGATSSGGFTYAGSNTVGAVAWYSVNAGSAQRVGTKLGNEIGTYDMSGNVAEWCFDVATVGMAPRRFRGGAYATLGELSVRTTRRSEQPPGAVNAWMGLRLARTP